MLLDLIIQINELISPALLSQFPLVTYYLIINMLLCTHTVFFHKKGAKSTHIFDLCQYSLNFYLTYVNSFYINGFQYLTEPL